MPPQPQRASNPRSYGSSGMVLGVALGLLASSRGGVEWAVEMAAWGLAITVGLLLLRRCGHVPVITLAFCGVIVAQGFQLIPVPSWVHSLVPGTRRVFEVALAPMGLYPAARPITLAPAESAAAIVSSIALVTVFTAAAVYADGSRRQWAAAVGIASAAVGVALVALLVPLASPESAFVPASFPFANANHLAGFQNLGAFVVLGVALHRTGNARTLWLVGFSLCTVVTFLTLSRGGIASYVVGVLAFVALERRCRSGPAYDTATLRRTFLVLAGVVLSLMLSAQLAFEAIAGQLGSLSTAVNETKVDVWRDALRMIADAPITGIGRGAFATAYTSWKSNPARLTFTHVENQWLQAVVELGVPFGLLLCGAVAAVWILAARRRDHSSVEVGLLAALAAVGAHETADFSLHVPAVALPSAIALGLVTRGLSRVVLPRIAGRAASAVAIIALATCGWAVAAHRVDRDIARIGGAPDARSSAAAAVAVVAWRPADYLPHAIVGDRFANEGRCGEAMPWLSRAMILAPTVPDPHLAAGQCLLASGQIELGRRELALAYAYGEPRALREAVTRLHRVDDLVAVVPPTADGLLLLGAALFGHRPADAVVVYQRALDEHQDRRALIPLAQLALEARQFEEALARANLVLETSPGDLTAHEIAASSLLRLGRLDDASRVISNGLVLGPSHQGLLTLAVREALRKRRFTEARRLAERLPAEAPSQLVRKYDLLARIMEAQGRLGDAISFAQSACGAAPDDVASIEYLAGLFERAGELTEAAAALDRASVLDGDRRASLRARADELRAVFARRQYRSSVEPYGPLQ